MKRAALLLALLFLPSQAAADAFSASTLEFQWDSLDATPAVLEFHGPGALTLEAESVSLEVDSLRVLQAGSTGAVVVQPAETTGTQYGPSLWQADADEGAASLFVVPRQARLVLAAGEGSASVPSAECVRQPDYFDAGRRLACPDVRDAMHVEAANAAWTLSGDFTLVLWTWKGTVREGDAASSFWTGVQQTSPGAQGVGEHEYRQAYLEVEHGTLWAQAQGDPLDLYATSVQALVPATTLHELSPADSAAPAQGPNRLLLTRGAQGLQGQLAPTSNTHPDRAWRDLGTQWQGGAAGMALLLVPLGVALVRANRGMRHLALANDNLELLNHRAAARHAALAVRHHHVRARAGLVGAVACIRCGDLDGAQGFLQHLHGTANHDEASCRFLLAHVRTLQGRTQEGQDLLEECLRINASCIEEAAISPVLAPLVDPSRWPRADP